MTKLLIEESVVRQALEVLEDRAFTDTDCEAITALRAAIENQPKVEPTCWVETDEDGDIAWGLDVCMSDDPSWFDNPIPLYTHPAPAVENVEPVLMYPGGGMFPIIEIPEDGPAPAVEKVEPVAWMHPSRDPHLLSHSAYTYGSASIPLYTHPAPATNPHGHGMRGYAEGFDIRAYEKEVEDVQAKAQTGHITWDASAPITLTPHPKFSHATETALTVTDEGEFQWHEDADELIAKESGAMGFVLRKLRSSEKVEASWKVLP